MCSIFFFFLTEVLFVDTVKSEKRSSRSSKGTYNHVNFCVCHITYHSIEHNSGPHRIVDKLFSNTRYFVIKSNNFENVEIAKSKVRGYRLFYCVHFFFFLSECVVYSSIQ